MRSNRESKKQERILNIRSSRVYFISRVLWEAAEKVRNRRESILSCFLKKQERILNIRSSREYKKLQSIMRSSRESKKQEGILNIRSNREFKKQESIMRSSRESSNRKEGEPSISFEVNSTELEKWVPRHWWSLLITDDKYIWQFEQILFAT